ncbi:MAG: hypothetical protein KDA78_19065, partial [Planctomycetaceae bacterium]|nr:hypothetical protein [Planctomycetaceae bacterium]
MAKKKKSSPSRKYLSQSEFPGITLERAIQVAQSIWSNFKANKVQPQEVAQSLDLAPSSIAWRNLCSSSAAYGLTIGGYGADNIALTDIGRRIVAPIEEGEDRDAMIESILKPRIMREFYQKYNKAKFPSDEIAKNWLVSFGLPTTRTQEALNILKENAVFTGITHVNKAGAFVTLGNTVIKSVNKSDEISIPERFESAVFFSSPKENSLIPQA